MTDPSVLGVGERVERIDFPTPMRGTVTEAKEFSVFVTVTADDPDGARAALRGLTIDQRQCSGDGSTFWIHRGRLRRLSAVELLAEQV